MMQYLFGLLVESHFSPDLMPPQSSSTRGWAKRDIITTKYPHTMIDCDCREWMRSTEVQYPRC